MSNPITKIKEYWNLAWSHSGGRKRYALYIFFDMIYCRARYGAYLDSYYIYEFYRFNHFVINDFLTYKTQSHFWTAFNAAEAHQLFVNKFRFNERFREFVHREYMLADAVSADAVREFIGKMGAVIVKPLDEHCGIGIFRLDATDEAQVNEFVATLSARTYIVEQIVRNAEALRKLNPYSLNTLRMVTCIDREGKLHIISGTLRIGGGTSCVDNAHSYGMACAVNLDLGIVDGCARDRDGNQFIVHPLTGEVIIGLRIPRWDEMKPYLERLVFVEPTARYVGWDIAVTDDGFELIEGNTDHDADVMQMCHLTGRYRQIKSML